MPSSYFNELCKAMEMLAENPKAVFMGQSVGYPGTAIYNTLTGIDIRRRVELPVAEDMQMGMAIGAALNGDLPICIYPRWNFLLLASSQLVLHLDKLPIYSRGGFRPRMIIRTAVATPEPLNPGPQHLGDYSTMYEQMLETVRVVRLHEASDIVPAYRRAVTSDTPTLLVEYAENY